jgi:cytochrome P450
VKHERNIAAASTSPDLSHIPGEQGWPVIGTLLEQLRDPNAFGRRMRARYGPVYRTRTFGRDWVAMLGPEANELVLFDKDKLFSSEFGWAPMLERLFPRGLMLMDGEMHRAHRRILSAAFKPPPMRRYSDAMEAGIATRVKSWSGRDILFYPEIKQLTLDLAASSFLGLPLGPEADRINKAFIDMVAASVAVVRAPLPMTAMGRGVAGRRFLLDLFMREVPLRREGEGEDLFSQVCRATDEDGQALDPQQIADHMIFLMMAAHDTITSSLTATVWQLGLNPEWQERLREEAAGSGSVDDLHLCDQAFREALRLMAPVPSIPRRSVKPFRFGGYDVPADTQIIVSPSFVHRMEEIWPDPARFDPARFSPEAVRARHKYAWVPFGGGAHMCLGLHFAMMQAKLFLRALLPEHRIRLTSAQPAPWQAWPIPKPRDGLPVRLERC